MNKRAREILSSLLTKSEYGQTASLKSFAELFEVTVRTIRNDINQINDYLQENGLSPLVLGKNGVIEYESDIRNAKQYLKQEEFYAFKLSKEERVMFSALLLVSTDCYITLSELANYLMISRSTVIQDLDGLKQFFRKNQLYLMSYSNKGLLLEGQEISRRNLLIDMVQSSSIIFQEFTIYQYLEECLSEHLIMDFEEQNILEKIINESEHIYGRFMTDQGFMQLRNYLKIVLCRWKKGYFVETPVEKNPKYEMAKQIISQMQLFFVDNIPESEVGVLAKMLNQIRYIKKETSNKEIVKMQVITRSFIDRISNQLDVKLQKDYIFYENLLNHLESTFSTVAQHFNTNVLVDEALQKYPRVLEVTQENVSIFEEYLGRTLSPEEVAFIVVHICAAIERNRNLHNKYSVVLVCNGGIGTSQLLQARLKKFFQLDVVDVISAHNLRSFDLDSVDTVISTISLDDYDVDYIQIDPLMKDEDYIRVGEKLSLIHPQKEEEHEVKNSDIRAVEALEEIRDIVKLHKETPLLIEKIEQVLDNFFKKDKEVLLMDLLPPEAIQLHVSCSDWKDAVRKSAAWLLETDAITEHYIEAMIENITTNGPYIVLAPGFALPHEALDAGAKRTGMSMIRLETPVPFGKEGMDPIEWVCCLSTIDKEVHLKAMFHLVNLFYNQSFRENILRCTSGEEIYRVIQQYEYNM